MAEALRRPELERIVATSAACAAPQAAGLDWFRFDGEGVSSWNARKKELRAACLGCPALHACRELALRERDGSGPGNQSHMVRAGLTNMELRERLVAEGDRLDAARREDDRARRERQALYKAAKKLETYVKKWPDHMDGNNHLVRAAADELAQLRTARRANAGWGEVA
jgi:WhiB family redox-sensing transcriptional regulator